MKEMNAIIFYVQKLWGSNFNLTGEFSLCLREGNSEILIVVSIIKICTMSIRA